MKIVIDAGHGANTPGKRTPLFPDGHFMHEHEFNMATANYVVGLLNQYDGVQVLKTYEVVRDVPLIERTNKANAWGADVFVSIHANAVGSGWNDGHGIETYVYSTRPKEAVALAQNVQKELVKVTGLYDRGVKDANFHVLRESHMTAILTECGFMTNRHEAELLESDDYRRKCAAAIVEGLVEQYGLKKTESHSLTNIGTKAGGSITIPNKSPNMYRLVKGTDILDTQSGVIIYQKLSDGFRVQSVPVDKQISDDMVRFVNKDGHIVDSSDTKVINSLINQGYIALKINK